MSGRTAARLPIGATCRRCDQPFAPTPYQVRNSAWICRPCQAAEDMANKLRRRAVARAFIDGVNARTFCGDCAAQPVEWHNPDHVQRGLQRQQIGNMVANGRSVEAIKAELARCTPLCRRCHMREDGRLAKFAAIRPTPRRGPRPIQQPPNPCAECSRLYKPLRRSLCSRCYARKRWASLRRAT